MILDSGVLTIYAVSSTEGAAPPPVKHRLEEKLTALYGEKVVGASSYYAAAKAGQRIDRAVRIWRAPSVTVRDVCLVDGAYYRIQKVTPTTDGDGMLVTDLFLEDDDDVLRGWADEGQG